MEDDIGKVIRVHDNAHYSLKLFSARIKKSMTDVASKAILDHIANEVKSQQKDSEEKEVNDGQVHQSNDN